MFLFMSCEDSTYKEYTGNAPVYMTYDDLRKSVTTEQNVNLENPGKIYFKDNYIFIVEELKVRTETCFLSATATQDLRSMMLPILKRLACTLYIHTPI